MTYRVESGKHMDGIACVSGGQVINKALLLIHNFNSDKL